MKKKAKKVARSSLKDDSHLEDALLPRLKAVPEIAELYLVRNHKPFVGNALEFDFAWPIQKIAIEVHGGIDMPGRRSGHVSRDGLRRDYYKCNLAQLGGWILLQFPPEYCTCNNHWHKVAKKLLLKAFAKRAV